MKKEKKIKWKKQLRDEFGIHFKNSSDELRFLEAFIEDLLSQQKEEIKKMILDKIDKDYKGRDITIYELGDWIDDNL